MKGLSFILISIFIHFSLIIFLKKPMFQHKFFDLISLIKSPIILLNNSEFNGYFFLFIIFPKLKIC